MPFSCVFQLNNGAIKPSDEIIFLKYIDESFGKYHSEKVKIAEVLFNNSHAFILSNCPSFPTTKGDLLWGEKLTPDTKIAYFAANGEDIPYNRPYAIISFE